ncbi:MAG TPA: transglycosylase domain-containing protein, partial [Candidatus Deferrimicrobiaceae bacterium]|nr:transglycosylase domain-containing protein [Candidatus Deferrimicrobiaceae bacterium]
MKSLFRPRTLLAALAGLFFLHLGYLYFKVGAGIARDAWEVPSILYGRAATIRPGDPLDNLRLAERLSRLSYRKVPGKPELPGTWSLEEGRIRIHTRGFRAGDASHSPVRAEIGISERRVASLETSSGAPLEELVLEPEEIARILGPKMESRRMVPLSAVPKHLQNAVLAAEDARFYSHFGIDMIGILRALGANLRRMRIVQGGSTITQQLAKNFFLTPKRSLWRKIREAELAVLIEARFTKEQILEAYLNKIYFGQEGPRGIYGVADAADFYFSKSVGDLSLEEAALLAGIIRSPNRYSPLHMVDNSRERRNWVLSRMASLGMI